MYGLTPFSQVMDVDDSFYDTLKATGCYEELPTDISKADLKRLLPMWIASTPIHG